MANDKLIVIPAIPVRQPIGTFYVGKADARTIRNACEFDYRRIRDKGGYKDFLGIQRELKQNRLKDIGRYIDTVDAVFPTGVVLSADSRTVTIKQTGVGEFIEILFTPYIDPEDEELTIPYGDLFSIIDGQHRLMAFNFSKENENFEINVAIFIDADDGMEAEIFSTVNLAQTKVNKSLVYDLFSLQSSRSPEKTCHEIVVNLDRLDSSPFQNKIKRLGTATEGRIGETLSQATMVRGILPYLTADPFKDREHGKRIGFWDPIDTKQSQKRIFFEFFRNSEDARILKILINYFNAVARKWPEAWNNSGTGNILSKTNGYNGLIRFLRPAYQNFTTTNEIVTEDQFYSLFKPLNLKDSDFNRTRYVPGSSGAKQLYNDLLEYTDIKN
jgi:DGQHR domain-containing protein